MRKKLEISSRKFVIPREHSMKRWTQEEQGPNRSRSDQEKEARIHRRTVQKKGLNDPDNHDVVVIHLEPDILEFEVKSALGTITMTKASGGDGIPAERFQILKADAQSYNQCVNKSGKHRNGHRTEKGQISVQSQIKIMLKNIQNTVQLCSFFCASKIMLKTLQARLLNSM